MVGHHGQPGKPSSEQVWWASGTKPGTLQHTLLQCSAHPDNWRTNNKNLVMAPTSSLIESNKEKSSPKMIVFFIHVKYTLLGGLELAVCGWGLLLELRRWCKLPVLLPGWLGWRAPTRRVRLHQSTKQKKNQTLLSPLKEHIPVSASCYDPVWAGEGTGPLTWTSWTASTSTCTSPSGTASWYQPYSKV